jgi:hypothetical protein
MDKTFNSTHICQRILFCPRTDHKEFVKDYVEEVLKDKPATNIPTPTKRSTYTVLHLTDPHLDLQYQEVISKKKYFETNHCKGIQRFLY